MPIACIQLGAWAIRPAWKSERRANLDEDWSVEAATHGGHPLLLLGDADVDPHDVRAAGVDLAEDRGLLFVRQRPVGGRVAADDAHAGVAVAEVERQLHQRALRLAGPQVRQVVQHRPDLRQVDLDVGERRRAEGHHDGHARATVEDVAG